MENVSNTNDNMKLVGRVLKALPVMYGENERGAYIKQQLLIQVNKEKYINYVALALWGPLVNTAMDGDFVEVFFSIESKKYEDRYITHVNAWKINVIEKNK